MNAYTEFCANEIIGKPNVERLVKRGWTIVDAGEIEELRRKCERYDQAMRDIIESKQKDLEITGRNVRRIESMRGQIKRGANEINELEN